MKRQSPNLSIPTLRDAYQVAGFRVRTRLTNLQGMTYRALVLTLERRSKKRGATDAAKACHRLYGIRWRRVRDLSCGDREGYLDFPLRRVKCQACGVKNEQLDFLSAHPKFTLRFALQIGGLCRAMTISDVARRMRLDWHTVKELDKIYMREQIRRAGPPKPQVIGVVEGE